MVYYLYLILNLIGVIGVIAVRISNIADISLFENLQDNANTAMGMQSYVAAFNDQADSKRMIDLFEKAEKSKEEITEFWTLFEKQGLYLDALDFTKLTAAQQQETDDFVYVYSQIEEHLQRHKKDKTVMDRIMDKVTQ